MDYPYGSSQSSTSISSVSSGFSELGIPINEEVDIISLNAQLMNLREEHMLLNHHVNRGMGYQQDIYDHQYTTRATLRDVCEKLTELSGNQKNHNKKTQEMADMRVEEICKIADPYLHSGQVPSTHQIDTVDRCAKLLGSVKGISGVLAKTRDLPKRVMDTHHKINQMEKKQRDAMSRFEEVTRVQALQHDLPESDPIYQLAHLPQLLLSLSMSPDVSPSYAKTFKDLEQRTASLVAQIRFNGTANGTAQPPIENAEFAGSIESMSNGEIDLESIFDNNEHPLDSLKVKTPELVN